jgi:hypothetical protein
MSKLEKYEWESLWWEEPENKDKRHILYIGDSISRGTTPKINAFGKNIAIDNFATSKAVDNPAFLKTLEVFATQNPGYTTVLFNNGLHGWHMSVEEYEKHYETILKKILDLFSNVKPYVILSTFTKTENNAMTILRNAAAKRIAEQYGVEVIDFYTLSERNADKICSDNVHFTNDGYELLAREILGKI